MAGRARLIQNSFTSGELSPRMTGRPDIDFYFNGAETVENFIVLPQGGLKTRPGFRYVANVGDTDLTANVRLIPFLFNDEQAYVVEVGTSYFRFYKNTAQILVPQTDAVIANGTFNTALTSWTLRSSGTGSVVWHASGAASLTAGNPGTGNEARLYQQVLIGAAYRNVQHVLRFSVSSFSGSTVKVAIGTTVGGTDLHSPTAASFSGGYHTIAFNPGGASSVYVEFQVITTSQNAFVDNVLLLSNEPVSLPNGILPSGTRGVHTAASIFDVQFDQSADVMWLTHRTMKPRKLSRRGDSSWSLTEYTPANDPFVNSTAFPRAVALWRSRLWFGGTDAGPNQFWATRVDDFENLDPGTGLDNQAINGVIAGGRINVIRSLAGLDKQLFVGTYGSEMFIRGDTAGKVASATVNITPATSHGVARLVPVKAAGFLLFLQRSQRKIRQLTYDFSTDAFVAPDLLLLADHLATKQLIDLSYAEDPDPIIWAVSDSGELLGATFLPSHKVLGWHRHITQGTVEAVTVIPHPDGNRDQVWVIVRRTINGVAKRFVEVFEDGAGHYGQYTLDAALHYEDKRSFDLTLSALSGTGIQVTGGVPGDAPFLATDVGKQLWHGKGLTRGVLQITQFLDSRNIIGNVLVPFTSLLIHASLLEDGPWLIASQTFTQASHLEGQQVEILADGAAHPPRTVVAGSFTLDQFAARVEAGLGFTPRLVTLRPEIRGQSTVQGLTATRSEIKVRVLDTVTLAVNGQVIPERSSADSMDIAPPRVSGDLAVANIGWEDDAKITITQDTHQPALIVALMSHLWFGDE